MHAAHVFGIQYKACCQHMHARMSANIHFCHLSELQLFCIEDFYSKFYDLYQRLECCNLDHIALLSTKHRKAHILNSQHSTTNQTWMVNTVCILNGEVAMNCWLLCNTCDSYETQCVNPNDVP